MHKATILSLPG